ncbi:MAG: hypothetical protein PW791_06170 [Neorhizobium sp.]|nr:hypothetical protein [Neorhizobium sp.]
MTRSIRFACLAVLVFMPISIVMTGCSVSADGPVPDYQIGSDLAPIPGSITYHGQPRTKLTKAPVGSSFDHEFRDQYGLLVHETYLIQPDRSLKIVSRRVFRSPFGNDDP